MAFSPRLPTERASDGRTGLAKALEGGRALIILDLMLRGLNGQAACARIREKDPLVPLTMLTARSEEADRVAGLEIGADEYVTKPFSVRELQARVKAPLRRVQAVHPAANAQFYGLPQPHRHTLQFLSAPVLPSRLAAHPLQPISEARP